MKTDATTKAEDYYRPM